MIGSARMQNSSREILYIDYEVAGFHSVILDMAKPLYNDVFFNIFYADVLQLEGPLDISVSFEQNTTSIYFHLKLDSLSEAIMDIKNCYLYTPFRQIAKSVDFDLYNAEDMRKLGFALFACAVLSRDFCGKWNVFFANLAVGVLLSQVRTLTELENFVHGRTGTS